MKGYLYNLATDRYQGFFCGLVKIFLLVLSGIYGLIMRFLAVFYSLRPCRLACKVISVGNITLGGTGKTPLAEYIARLLKERGHKVAILTRGYKRKVASRQSPVASSEAMGDEAQMLSQNLAGIPIIVDADRYRGAKTAIRDHAADTVILDDGFQQWRIKKDLEIVVIDAVNPFGNRRLLPRGILREPLSSLRRADIFVLTKTDLAADFSAAKDYLRRINAPALIVESRHALKSLYALADRADILPLEALKDKQVALVSGIGDPASFEEGIKKLGISIGSHFIFSDHHRYSRQDLDGIFACCRQKNITTVITTEKDAVRFGGLPIKEAGIPVFVLPIQLELTKNEEGFISRLFSLYNP
ncbi:MAG: tetraacyldisaccharide 4'-kinase [Candidatus Omnitrophica bacterium]|nr:tetraacyldisaccharide 4'-kinase [Candidatus Omnitrophota bacterium]